MNDGGVPANGWKNPLRSLRSRVLGLGLPRATLRLACRAGLVPASLWMRLPLKATFPVDWKGRKAFDYAMEADDPIGRGLYWRGWPSIEPETLSVFHDLCLSARIFADVGANTGVFTLLACAANPDLKAVAFEPLPRIRARLQEQLRVNGWEGRCSVRPEAVSDRQGSATFEGPDMSDLPTISSLAATGADRPGWSRIEVPVTTLDASCPPGEEPDLVKIDVEGVEDKVLAGMTRILRDRRPAVILECNPGGPAGQIQEILGGFGYRISHLRPAGPVAVDRISPDPTGRWRNFLCLPEGR